MGVAGTDQSDSPWSQSNTGADTFLAAPATSIPADATDGSETSITGTSASAAMVAGAAALLMANDSSATNAIVAGRLARNADAVGTGDETGNGRLNIARAFSDTTTDPVTPLGAPGGGPFVGPYATSASAITLAPPSGQGRTPVAVSGVDNPWTGGTVTIKWDGTTQTTCSINGGGNITGTCQFNVPAGATVGNHTVLA